MSELKHAAMPESPDYGMIGYDLLFIGVNFLDDVRDRERFKTALCDAAKLCFEVDSLKTSMMELYKQLEGMK